MLFRIILYLFILGFFIITGCASQGTKQDISLAAVDETTDSIAESTSDASSDTLSEDGEGVVISEISIKKPENKKKSLLAKLTKQFRWNHLYGSNKRVQYELSLMRDNQAYVDETFSGARTFLHYVVQQVEHNNMPVELTLLPGVESQFKPLAYSFAHAAGMWQIIPSTAEALGLELNWWQDQRRDVVAATQAGIDYLTSMSSRFNGDWLLALAAYNAGPVRVERAIQKNKKAGKPTDYWSLKLPRETKRYVPRLIALVELVSNPKRYGVKIPPIADEPVFTSIVINDKQIDLNRLAVHTGYSKAELITFNSGLNQRFTKPFGEYLLHIPLYMEEKVRDYLDSDASVVTEYWISYKPSQGESLDRIAKKFTTQASRLGEINRLSKTQKVYPGRYLLVPVDSEQKARHAHFQAESPDKILVKTGISERYKLQRGDSLWKLSRKFKVSLDDLMRWNKITENTKLYAGKSIYIKRAAYSREAPINLAPHFQHKLLSKVYYPVRSGDTLSSIVNRFEVTKKDILKWNPQVRSNGLRAKKTIILHVDVTQTY